MLAMQEYQELLKIALKLEKLNMYDSAQEIYKKYLKAVSYVNPSYPDILYFFYGPSVYEDMEIKGYDEAINKAIVAENLKKLYYKLDGYRQNWNGDENASEVDNNKLMEFLRWADKDKKVNIRDIEIIKPFLQSIADGRGFNISVPVQTNLMTLIYGAINKQYIIDPYRNVVQ